VDDLRLPDDLQHLWNARKNTKEEVEPIMTQVLREARHFRMRRRGLDIALMVAYALLLPLTFLSVLIARDHFGEPMVALGYGVWSVTLVWGLVAYGLFYRSFRDQPSHDADGRRYISEYIDYLNRRQRFLTKSAISASILLALAGAVFALALYRGQDALFHVIISFVGQPLLIWDVLRMERNYERRRSRVNEILADMNAD
jgi:hypothetical protein